MRPLYLFKFLAFEMGAVVKETRNQMNPKLVDYFNLLLF